MYRRRTDSSSYASRTFPLFTSNVFTVEVSLHVDEVSLAKVPSSANVKKGETKAAKDKRKLGSSEPQVNVQRKCRGQCSIAALLPLSPVHAATSRAFFLYPTGWHLPMLEKLAFRRLSTTPRLPVHAQAGPARFGEIRHIRPARLPLSGLEVSAGTFFTALRLPKWTPASARTSSLLSASTSNSAPSSRTSSSIF